MLMKTILVTGGMGYIGSHTCVELISAGYKPIIVDNLCNSKPEVLNRIEKITGKRPAFYECDVRNEEKMDEIFSENQIDAVIHFAGLKAVGESVKKPDLYFDNNIGSTEVLLRIMKKHGCRSMIFSSSATVYGDPKRVPIFEDDPVGATTNPYAETKYRIENMLKGLYGSDNSWNFVILRYFNPIGAHSSGLMGEDPQGILRQHQPRVGRQHLRSRCLRHHQYPHHSLHDVRASRLATSALDPDRHLRVHIRRGIRLRTLLLQHPLLHKRTASSAAGNHGERNHPGGNRRDTRGERGNAASRRLRTDARRTLPPHTRGKDVPHPRTQPHDTCQQARYQAQRHSPQHTPLCRNQFLQLHPFAPHRLYRRDA